MTKLLEAFRWYRLGVSWRKAIQLANMKRKERYHRELGLMLAIAAAYAIVGHNDLGDVCLGQRCRFQSRLRLRPHFASTCRSGMSGVRGQDAE